MTIPPDPLDCSPVTVLVALVVAGAQLSLDPSGRVRVRARQKLPANLLAAARFWAPALAQVAGGLEAPPPRATGRAPPSKARRRRPRR